MGRSRTDTILQTDDGDLEMNQDVFGSKPDRLVDGSGAGGGSGVVTVFVFSLWVVSSMRWGKWRANRAGGENRTQNSVPAVLV